MTCVWCASVRRPRSSFNNEPGLYAVTYVLADCGTIAVTTRLSPVIASLPALKFLRLSSCFYR